MPTAIGLVFITLGMFLFIRQDESLFGLLVFSSIFAAASIFQGGSHGVQPFFAVGLLYCIQCFLRGRYFQKRTYRYKGSMVALAFGAFAICTAFTLPFIFAGTPVYDPYVGIDQGLLNRPPLHFALANVTQSFYILLDILILFGAAIGGRHFHSVRRAYLFTFYFLCALVFVQFAFGMLRVPFPYSLFQNHAGYGMQRAQLASWRSRFPGTFSESSYAGVVIAGFTSGFLAQQLRRGGALFPSALGLLTIILVRSSASLVAIGIVIFSLLVRNPIFRLPNLIDRAQLRRSALILCLLAAAVGAVLLSPLTASIQTLTVGKDNTASYKDRHAADLYALELVKVTKGLGVGMGSNRPSSLITSLLSTTGVVGTCLFLSSLFLLFRNAQGEDEWLRWAGGSLLLGMALAIPDYFWPPLWIFGALAVQSRFQSAIRKREIPRPEHLALSK